MDSMPSLELSTPLPVRWCVWIHDCRNADYSPSSYILIGHLSNGEDFFRIMRNIKPFIHNTEIFIMRQDIFPTWEAPENENGGAWSIRIPVESSFTEFKTYCAFLVWGRIAVKNPEKICGVTITPPKYKYSVLKIWNSDWNSAYTSIDCLEPSLQKEGWRYQRHNSNRF